jgi:crotonobetainyl-CoA:carnitine CoA-transferase CaiB-like acyl-CoA transferase
VLDGYKVLDLSGRLGWLTGRILVDLGADVVKVEDPGADRNDADWRAFNVGKRLLVLDLTAEAGQQAILAALPKVDMLIESAAPDGPEAAWLDPDRLAEINPELIHVSVTPFGREGPRAGWRGGDLEIMAAGGAMSIVGEPDGRPLRISVPQSYVWAGAHAAAGALVALTHRSAGGGGQHVDVSGQASIVTSLAHAPTFVDMLGVVPGRVGSGIGGRSVHGGTYQAFWPCKDGYINFILYGGPAGRRTNKALVEWMREKDLDLGVLAEIDWDTYDPILADQAEIDRLEAPIATFFETVTKAEFLDGAFRREMLGYPVSTVADIAADPQLTAREFWQELPLPDGGSERHCGAFYRIDGERPALASAAAGNGGDSRDILLELGLPATQIDALEAKHVMALE